MNKYRTPINDFIKAYPNLPNFIKYNGIYDVIKDVNKIFPHIGLQNFKEEIVINNSKEAYKSAELLLKEIYNQVLSIKTKLSSAIKTSKKVSKPKKTAAVKLKPKKKSVLDDDTKELKIKLIKLTSLLSSDNKRKRFIVDESDKLSLRFPVAVKDRDKTLFNKNEKLFGVLNKIITSSEKIKKIVPLDQWNLFKKFSSNNFTKKKQHIVFSSHGNEGLWDIATMSMRGITSCQSWNGQDGLQTSLNGSILDPFTGIIYLTNNDKTNYGSKMLHRAIVRFLINIKTKNKFLFIDKIYPNDAASVREQFEKILLKNLKNDIKILKNPIKDSNQYQYPTSKTTKMIFGSLCCSNNLLGISSDAYYFTSTIAKGSIQEINGKYYLNSTDMPLSEHDNGLFPYEDHTFIRSINYPKYQKILEDAFNGKLKNNHEYDCVPIVKDIIRGIKYTNKYRDIIEKELGKQNTHRDTFIRMIENIKNSIIDTAYELKTDITDKRQLYVFMFKNKTKLLYELKKTKVYSSFPRGYYNNPGYFDKNKVYLVFSQMLDKILKDILNSLINKSEPLPLP